MTDPVNIFGPDTGDEASDDQVRQLLAAACSDEPMPPEVVSRLDDVLASLVEQRGETTLDTTAEALIEQPIGLAAERGRRRFNWLGAAAAAFVVVAAGVTLPQLLGPSDSTNDRSTAASDVANNQEALTALPALPEITSTSAKADVTAFVRTLKEPVPSTELRAQDAEAGADFGTESGTAAPDALGEPLPESSDGSQCGWTGSGVLYPVSYDGEPADLVLQRKGKRLIARIFTCSEGAVPTVARTVIVSPAA